MSDETLVFLLPVLALCWVCNRSSACVEANMTKNEIEQILAQRKEQYGEYKAVAKMTAKACKALKIDDGLRKKHFAHWFAAVMILNKLARVRNGEINHKDSWDDIAGYARLISQLIKTEQKEPFGLSPSAK